MNSLQAITATILAITSIIGACALGVKWLVKHYLFELKPNGGSSLRDAQTLIHKKVDRIEEKQDKQGERIDKVYELLCDLKAGK